MAWVKLDDGFFDNPKVAAAGPVGALLYLASLCYCARALTDGWVPAAQVPVLVAQVRATKGVVAKVLEAGLWVELAEHPDAFWIPDYLEHNPSRDDVLETRRSARERRAKGGRTSGGRSREPSRGVRANDVSPVPSPPQDQPTRAAAYSSEFEPIWDNYPRKIAKQQAFRAFQARRRAGVEVTELAAAVENYAAECDRDQRETRYRLHGATFFGPNERWREYVDGVPEPGSSNGNGAAHAPALGVVEPPPRLKRECPLGLCGGTTRVFNDAGDAVPCACTKESAS